MYTNKTIFTAMFSFHIKKYFIVTLHSIITYSSQIAVLIWNFILFPWVCRQKFYKQFWFSFLECRQFFIYINILVSIYLIYQMVPIIEIERE